MAFPTGWRKLAKLTIDNTKVSGSSNHTDFPVLITEASLGSLSSLCFSNTDNGGGDVRFSSDESGSTQLSCEIVSWDTSGETCEVWVKIPTLSYNSDTVFYLWGDNTTETQPAEDAAYGKESVWKSGYKAVYHLTNLVDSTSNDNDMTNSGAAAGTGKVGGAYEFTASEADYASVADSANNSITGDITFEFWIKYNSLGTANRQVISKSDYGTPSYGFNIDMGASATLDTLRFRYIQSGGGANQTRANADSAFTDPDDVGVWFHQFCAIDVSTQTFTWYQNGSANAHTVDQTSASNINDSSAPLALAAQFNGGSQGGNTHDGFLDEVRVYSGLLSADWGITSYNTQSSPSTFMSASSVSNIKKFISIAQSNIKKVLGITNANIKKISEVSN